MTKGIRRVFRAEATGLVVAAGVMSRLQFVQIIAASSIAAPQNGQGLMANKLSGSVADAERAAWSIDVKDGRV